MFAIRTLFSRFTHGRRKEYESESERWLESILLIAAIRSEQMVIVISHDSSDPGFLRASVQKPPNSADQFCRIQQDAFEPLVQLLMTRGDKARDRYGLQPGSIAYSAFRYQSSGKHFQVQAVIRRREGDDSITLTIDPMSS